VAIDHDVLEVLEDFEESAESRGLNVETIPREERAKPALYAA
jgi:hypothetical protein